MKNTSQRVFWKLNKIIHEGSFFLRSTPNLLIVGTSFCGKTLLYNYLVQHKSVLENLREETSYFINNYEKGFNWYRSNFPTKFNIKLNEIVSKNKIYVGETVNIPEPEIPERISKIIKKPKIILILRNPTERAYARYLAMVRANMESRQFEEVVDESIKILSQDNNCNKNKPVLEDASKYLTRGLYVNYLKRWNEFFPKEKMLVLKTEDLINNPLKTVNKTLDFLDLAHLESLMHNDPFYEKNAPQMSTQVRKKLDSFYSPFNEELYQFLELDLGWSDVNG